MKKYLFVAMISMGYALQAQVGINNTNPQATLDISATNAASPSNTDGILIPRVDDFPSTDPTASQDGLMVFITGNGTPSKGFYYWDNTTTSWAAVTAAGGGTLDDAYDFGGAGSGNTITATDGAVTIAGEDGVWLQETLDLELALEVLEPVPVCFLIQEKLHLELDL